MVKASVVMTPGYNSSVRIIGVASNTVIPTATQEAPLSKTSAFVLPETVMQTAEKFWGLLMCHQFLSNNMLLIYFHNL